MAKKEKFVVTTRWRQLSTEQQVAEIKQAMLERHTNRTAARALGTTPGIIAGLRHRHNIAPRERQEPAAPAARDAPEPTPRPRLAASEATQCRHVDENKLRCASERIAGSEFCLLHDRK